MNNPNAVQPCGIALTDELQYDTFEEWLNAAIDFANERIKETEPGTTNSVAWSTEWQILKVVQRRAELYGVVLDNPENAIGYGLKCNIQVYVKDQVNNIDMPLVRAGIEECLVEHSTDIRNAKFWLLAVAPQDVYQWPPKVKSLCQFIETQVID